MIIFETRNIRFAMDEDGLEGTIEDKNDHPGHCVLESIEPQDILKLRKWCDKVFANLEKTLKEHPDSIIADKEALKEWKSL